MLKVAADNKLDEVSAALARGVNVNYQTKMLPGIFYGARVCVSTTDSAGHCIYYSGKSGNTALMLAAWKGHEAMVALLLEKGADVNLRGHEPHDVALMKAAAQGHEAVVALLLESGAKLNLTTSCYGRSDGKTALTYAAAGGHEAVVALLLERGADLNLQTAATDGGRRGGDTPLMVAIEGGHESTVALLLERGAKLNLRCEEP